MLQILCLQMVVLEDVDGEKGDVLRQKRGASRQYLYDVAFGEDSTQVPLFHIQYI